MSITFVIWVCCSSGFQPKEGYTSLKNAYPNLFEGEEDKEDKLPRRKGRKSRTGRPRKCNQIPRKQAPLADPLLEPTASDNGKASGNQSVLHLNASKLNFPSREKSVQAAIHTLQNTGYGLTGVDEQFISPDETLTVDIEQKRVLYALVSFKIHPKRKIQVVRPPNDDSDGYFYQPILPKNLEHIWLELLGVQLIPSTKVHAVPREKNVRSVAIGTDKTNVIGPNSKLNSITKKFVPVLKKNTGPAEMMSIQKKLERVKASIKSKENLKPIESKICMPGKQDIPKNLSVYDERGIKHDGQKRFVLTRTPSKIEEPTRCSEWKSSSELILNDRRNQQSIDTESDVSESELNICEESDWKNSKLNRSFREVTEERKIFGYKYSKDISNKVEKNYNLYYQKLRPENSLKPNETHPGRPKKEEMVDFEIRVYPDLQMNAPYDSSQRSYRENRSKKVHKRVIVCPSNCLCWQDEKKSSDREVNSPEICKRRIDTHQMTSEGLFGESEEQIIGDENNEVESESEQGTDYAIAPPSPEIGNRVPTVEEMTLSPASCIGVGARSGKISQKIRSEGKEPLQLMKKIGFNYF